MSTYRQILYQIVFSTKNRQNVLSKDGHGELFKYIGGIIRNNKCKHYIINGVEDHVHILIDIHPTVALSNIVKDIKTGSSSFIKSKNLFPGFIGWQEGYGAFSYHIKSLDTLVKYISDQEEHHKRKSYLDELKNLLKEHNVEYDPKYLG
jgi:putative transposase